MRRLVQLLVPCLFLGGCFGPGEGLEVPPGEIYFPVGLALDVSHEHLFVVSSDFDLQYNGGAIQSYPLAGADGLEDQLPALCLVDSDCSEQPKATAKDATACEDGLCVKPGSPSKCPDDNDQSASAKVLYPARCGPFALKATDKVKIGAFATDVIMRSRLDGAQRLFVPVRGDTTLHWLDIEDDGKLECGQDNNDGHCDDRHRAGNDPESAPGGITLGAEPFAIDANQDGTTIVVTNQTTGTASLFVNEWVIHGGVNDGKLQDAEPRLRFALASDRIPTRPVGVAALPRVATPEDTTTPDAFLMTFRNSAQVRVIRFAPDTQEVAQGTPPREYLVDTGGVFIDANSIGSDSRGIAVDPSAREQAVKRCGDDECRAAAELTPIDVYVANRSPASLLIGRTRPPLEYPAFFQSLPLTLGPSRVVVGQVKTPDGDLESRVFVVCFDSRRIFVYDPKRARFEAEILTGRGPHAVAIDTERSLLYVGHFTDSFVGVFSLDLSHPDTYGTMLGMLGKPKPPRSSK